LALAWNFSLARNGNDNLLLRNDGNGVFTDSTLQAGDPGPAASAVWVDYDSDGLLDLHVVNDGATDIMYRNLSDAGDDIVLVATWVGIEDWGSGRCAAWGDYDGDGDPDVYLVRQQANILYTNFGPLFGFWDAEIAVLEDDGNGESAVWGDYDDDGDLDLYLANNGSADKLFKRSGTDYTPVIGSDLGSTGAAFGTSWSDVDLDGDLDLCLALANDYNRILRNDGGDVFTACIPTDTGHLDVTRGLACADHNGDGRPDMYLALEGVNRLLVNTETSEHHWLRVQLEGTSSNRSAYGSKLRAVVNGVSRYRWLTPACGYRSQDEDIISFGLGAATQVDTLEVIWPDGEVQVLGPFGADRLITIVQGVQTSIDSSLPLVFTLHPPVPNPFNSSTTIEFVVPFAEHVSLNVYDLAGHVVHTLVDGDQPAGKHAVVWDGCNASGRPVASGIYVYRLAAGTFSETRRMVLVK